ncbi:hypothetical protein Bca4012_036530 [Brassica carinata]
MGRLVISFNHYGLFAMVVMSAGGGDPLADSSLSTSDIISLLVDRKLAVNPVSAKGVDQLGQADVRDYVCDDADGELLSRGLGDQDDASVDNLVSLIEDDYPFEHNIWSGGVRADDVKANKGPASSPQSSGENVSSAVDKEKDMGGGGDSNMKSRERMDQSRRPPSFDPQPDENIPLDVPTLLRRAADAYEEKVLPMFEGYMLSLKGHFHTEVGTLRTDLQAIKTSVHDLETKVGVEFEKMKTLIKGGGFFDDEPYRGGGSPYRHDSPYEGGDDELPPAFVPPPHTTRMYSAPGGQASTSAPDVSASAEANLPIPSDGEAAAVHSAGVSCDEVTGAEVPRTESTDKTEAMNVDSATGQGGSTAVDRQPPLVTSPDPPPVQSPTGGDQGVASPTESHPTASLSGKEQALPTEVPESSSIPDVSTVVTQILTESGILKGTQDLPPTTSQPGKVCPPPSGTTQSVPLNAEDIVKSSTTPDKKTSGSSESSQSVGRKVQDKVSVVGQPHSAARVEDQSGGVVEKEAAVGGGSKKRPAESDAAAGVSTTADAGGDVERRHSKRTQKKTQKFTPPVPTVRKPATKKPPKAKDSNAPAPKRSKKAGVESSQPNPAPTSTLSSRDLPVFIGGFNAFAPPSASNREAFFKRLAFANPGSSISPLQDLFHCTGVCSHQALDRAVQCIRIRRDRLPAARFDFLPPSFFVELLHYSGFEASNDKATFTFSSNLKDQFLHRPQWFKQVDFVYSPACPSEFDVVGVLTPISNMLPYLIQKHCITTSPRDLRFLPLPISRIEVPMLIEHPGYSGVAAIILLEHVAAGQPLMSLSVTEEEVRHAAENYAIAALAIS